ncbi:hypothetical protein Pyn_40417 [Prunus yedoensis var. nudiflora]|uniref:Uncharacterized protein n=1 Tax=Prunus yedoensis var. nudiflora TaxID=2094558 RepID=A0A314V2J1_PRUYE|nr:hypothetical protein Pyn_40417 [Prunus yedoensis var. nudiflora]
MTDDVSEHLKLLWEELETFRVGQRKRLREDIDALEIKTKRLKAKLLLAEAKVALLCEAD